MTEATVPVEPRHAASLLVLRPGPLPAILMGMRGAGHRFMPNRLVFPGGAVDPGDYGAAASTPLTAEAAFLLGKAADPGLAHAIAIAATRELEEETGLTMGAPPALAVLRYLGRAITPPASPVRFDARFFVVDEGAVSGTLAGSGELEDLRWYGVEEALAIDLARPTRMVLGLFTQWLLLSPQERAARTQAPVLRNRVMELE